MRGSNKNHPYRTWNPFVCCPERLSRPIRVEKPVRRRGWSGQQGEGRDVAWPDGPEVTVVEGGDLGDVETFRDGDHGRIRCAEREVGVRRDVLCHPLIVGDLKIHDRDGAGDDRFQDQWAAGVVVMQAAAAAPTSG